METKLFCNAVVVGHLVSSLRITDGAKYLDFVDDC